MNRINLCLLLMLLSVSIQAVNSTKSTPKRVEISVTVPFASQVRYADTYYVIKDAIDLKGSSITIPNGCTLKLEGGQLSNGKITGNNTYIEASPYPIFANTIQMSGSFVAPEAYPEWFEDTDDAVRIRKALIHFDNVKLTARQYVLKSVDENGYGIVVPEGHILRGNRRANNTNAIKSYYDLFKGTKKEII